MGLAQGYKGARELSNSKISMGVNGSRTRTNNNEQMVSLEEPNFLGKVLWKVGTWPPKEYRARGNHTPKNKPQGKEPTVT